MRELCEDSSTSSFTFCVMLFEVSQSTAYSEPACKEAGAGTSHDILLCPVSRSTPLLSGYLP